MIKLENVNYIYGKNTNNEKLALDNINLEIKQGEFVGIIGHTGSGKSTLIQHLNGLLKACEGVIYFNGKNVYDKNYKLMDLRNKVGLVFQYSEYQLFETTVFKDVCFGPANQGLDKEEIRKRVYYALELAGVKKEQYEISPFDLSGGQKRRVAIAGVLAMKPDMIVLDEPTAGLDPRGKHEILDMISDLKEKTKMTVVLVSHSMEDIADYVSRIIVMDNGKIILDNTPKKVFLEREKLEKIGLAVPQVTNIIEELRKKGFDIKENVTTVKEAKECIMNLIKR